jgi:hypothetical protein
MNRTSKTEIEVSRVFVLAKINGFKIVEVEFLIVVVIVVNDYIPPRIDAIIYLYRTLL